MVVASIVVPEGAVEVLVLVLVSPRIAPAVKTRPNSAATTAASKSGCTWSLCPAGLPAGMGELALCDVDVAAPVSTGVRASAESDAEGREEDDSLVSCCIFRLQTR